MNPRRSSAAIVSVVLTGSLVGACGGEEQPAVCADVDALRTSLTALQAFDIYDTNVLSDLAVVLDGIRAEVQQLAEDSSTEYAEEIAVVHTSTDDLETSANAAVDAPTTANVATLADDVDAFTASFQELRAAVGDTC